MGRRGYCTWMRSRLLCFFLLMLVVSLDEDGAKIEREVESIAKNIGQQLTSTIHKTSTLLSPFNASAISLAGVLTSSIDEADASDFSNINSKVASVLFQTLSTFPYLRQISYIGMDGLLFSYYLEGNRTYALYSNTTFSMKVKSNSYSLYNQPVNSKTGKLINKEVLYKPFDVVNASWFRESLYRRDGYQWIGAGWSISEGNLLLISGVVGDRGVVSLGYSVKNLVDFLVLGVEFYNGSVYLATTEGTVLRQGTLELSNYYTEFCQYNKNSQHQVTKYLVQCSQIELLGVQLVLAITLPYKGLLAKLHNNKLEHVLLMLGTGYMMLMIGSLVYMMVGAAKKEMHLCNALIKQMEATRQSEKKSMNKSLAFARASHDIRASLAAFSGLIEHSRHLLSQTTYSRFHLEENLNLMEASIRDLSGILNSILDTSKIEAGKMQLVEEQFSMEELLEEVVDFYHPVGMKKGIDVILDPCDGSVIKLSSVTGDRCKLKQILSNLLSNAVKFTSEGNVTVRGWARKSCLDNRIIAPDRRESRSCSVGFLFKTERERRGSEDANVVRRSPSSVEFWFEVSDTGKGIPNEKRRMVFENYVQVKETALDQEGTGLGLGIVQSLVRLMRGEIEIVDKEEVERGTCIRFSVLMEAEASNNAIATIDGGYNYSSYFHNWRYLFRHNCSRSRVILFVQNDKRCTVLQNFMRRLEVKVQVVVCHNHLSQTLKSIKQGIGVSSSSSSSRNSNRQAVEAPLSGFDGEENASSPPWSKKKFILIVIDKRVGSFHDINMTLVEFRRNLHEDYCSRVIWLESDISASSIDESKLPPSDLVISKPFHGSRLYQAIGLLPEYGGIPPRRGDMLHANTYSQARYSKTEEVRNYIDNNKDRLKGKTILVVDDDQIGRILAKPVVENLGASIVLCESGEKACTLVSANLKGRGHGDTCAPFNCILMDCKMQGMDGIEATRRIRELEKNYGVHTQIVALTAHEKGDEEISKMIQAGADDYLTKPLTKESLLSKLKCKT